MEADSNKKALRPEQITHIGAPVLPSPSRRHVVKRLNFTRSLRSSHHHHHLSPSPFPFPFATPLSLSDIVNQHSCRYVERMRMVID